MADDAPKVSDPPKDAATLIHADGLQIAGGLWAFMLTILHTAHKENQAINFPVATVSIPWPLAKALHEMLGEAIHAYEEKETPINIPRSFAEIRRKAAAK